MEQLKSMMMVYKELFHYFIKSSEDQQVVLKTIGEFWGKNIGSIQITVRVLCNFGVLSTYSILKFLIQKMQSVDYSYELAYWDMLSEYLGQLHSLKVVNPQDEISVNQRAIWIVIEEILQKPSNLVKSRMVACVISNRPTISKHLAEIRPISPSIAKLLY